MRFHIQRETLFEQLQAVIGVVEKRQTMPILSHFLLQAEENQLRVTGTDLELELVASTPLIADETGGCAVPARKLFDICRSLPEGADLSLELREQRLTVRSGRSRFALATLPADQFPQVEEIGEGSSFIFQKQIFKSLIERTHFAMAHQDVRYFLNGLLLDVRKDRLRAVATDGHRLALCDARVPLDVGEAFQIIVPRKAITELQRLLGEEEDTIDVTITPNHLQITVDHVSFTTKLIDGRFPDYERVIPKRCTKRLSADRETVRRALSRAAILSNEKFRGVRLQLDDGRLKLWAHNPEQEEAEEELDVNYSGGSIEIGFNVAYLLDALAAMEAETFVLSLNTDEDSGLLTEEGSEDSLYVIMPMRL